MKSRAIRRRDRFAPILRQMPKDPTKTTLYQLIEAGQLARAALLRPLSPLGLEAGDDALIFALGRDDAVSDKTLCELTGLPPPQLLPRLERLIRLDLIIRADALETGPAGSRLTEKGAALRKQLLAHWQAVEAELTSGLGPKQRQRLQKNLARFTRKLIR